MKPAGLLLENGSQRLLSRCRRWYRRARIAFRVGWPKTWPNPHLRYSLPGAIEGSQRSATPRSAASRATLWLSRISAPPCSWVKSIPAPADCKPRNPRNQEYGARDHRCVIGRQAGIEDRGGHKQALVCFPSLQLYAPRPPAQTANRPVATSRRKPHRDLDCNAILDRKSVGAGKRVD